MGPTNMNDGDDVFDDIGGWPVIEMPIFQARLFSSMEIFICKITLKALKWLDDGEYISCLII